MRDFHLPGRSAVYARNGMCATSHPLAAKVAVQMLEAGGNAVDAAIAGAVLLGLCEPQMTGIGGDCFVLMTPAGEDRVVALNGSGRAPAALDASALRAQGHKEVPVYDPAAVTVPGAVDAFCKLSADFGKLGLKAVLAPSIYYAEAGIPIAPRVALDEALRLLATEGRAGFYEGAVAEDMVTSLNALGGVHTLDDFANTACDYTDPIQGAYGGLDLYEHPPNGQGATAVLLLNILKHFDIAGMDPFGAQRAHIEAEATKLAYDARNRFVSDPDHMTKLDHMLSFRGCSQGHHLHHGCRQGSDVRVVDLFHLPRVRLWHRIRPVRGAISEPRGRLYIGRRSRQRSGRRQAPPFGVMGGQYQSTGHARFVTNITDFGMTPQEAIDAPRCFTEAGKIAVERGYSDKVRAALSDMGHDVHVPDGAIGGAQAILLREDGVLEGGSDPRKDGIALGYWAEHIVQIGMGDWLTGVIRSQVLL